MLDFVLDIPTLKMTCKEILYATVMQSILVGCSILSIVISQFVAFISIRALGWMAQVKQFFIFLYFVSVVC